MAQRKNQDTVFITRNSKERSPRSSESDSGFRYLEFELYWIKSIIYAFVENMIVYYSAFDFMALEIA